MYDMGVFSCLERGDLKQEIWDAKKRPKTWKVVFVTRQIDNPQARVTCMEYAHHHAEFLCVLLVLRAGPDS